MKTLKDLDVQGKRVFVRCDFNVPVEGGRVTSDTRIRRTVPTLSHILERGGACVLASHFGRPKGGADPKYSLRVVVPKISELLGRSVLLLPDCVGPAVKDRVSKLKPGEAVLLENLRFHTAEEINDPTFSHKLAANANLYVNDAFGASHRAHASIVGIPQYLPSAAGLLLDAEVRHLGGLLREPAKPFVAILGGAKVSDKIQAIQALMQRVDAFLVGGAMAYTFLKALGHPVGTSMVEKEMLATASDLLKQAAARGVKIVLPVDHLTVETFDAASPVKVEEKISDGRLGVDIGPKTLALYQQVIARSKTVFWNGPMGVFEMEPFSVGTRRLAEALAGAKAHVVVGGGDSAAAVEQFGLDARMAHVSTGGGASLEYLGQGTLPGIEALEQAAKKTSR